MIEAKMKLTLLEDRPFYSNCKTAYLYFNAVRISPLDSDTTPMDSLLHGCPKWSYVFSKKRESIF